MSTYEIHLEYGGRIRNDFNTLCDRFGTDKGSVSCRSKYFDWPPHTYGDFYSLIFGHCRESVKKFFECGIGSVDATVPSNMGGNYSPGASLLMWREYFPNAEVYGADIDRSVLFTEDRIRTYYVDQTDLESVVAMWREIDTFDFDVIIDDGLHTLDAAICLFEGSAGRLKKDGIYLIEDVAYLEMPKYRSYFDGVDYAALYVTMFGGEYERGSELRNSIIVLQNIAGRT